MPTTTAPAMATNGSVARQRAEAARADACTCFGCVRGEWVRQDAVDYADAGSQQRRWLRSAQVIA